MYRKIKKQNIMKLKTNIYIKVDNLKKKYKSNINWKLGWSLYPQRIARCTLILLLLKVYIKKPIILTFNYKI